MAADGSEALLVGVGFRPEIAGPLLRGEGEATFLELLLEERLASRERALEAEALAEMRPVVVHGTKLSLGSAEGIDEGRATLLGDLARRTRAFAVTEHAAFVRSGGVEIGHLTPVPFSRAAADVIARNVARARRRLPDVPLLLENVAWPLRPGGDEMSEAEFYALLVERTGARLLFDVGNLYANARNAGVDPFDALRDFPVEAADMIHLAGSLERGGFVYDTHAHAVPEDVFAMLELTLDRRGRVPIVLERDHGLDWTEVSGEIGKAAAIGRQARPAGGESRDLAANREALSFRKGMPALSSPPAPLRSAEGEEALCAEGREALRVDQVALARALAGIEADERLDPVAVARARDILTHKRVEESLPLLPRLRAFAGVAPLAERHAHGTVRPRRRAAVTDARAIAEAAAASSDGALALAARLDRLALDARFVFDAEGASPR
ncbi:MAG: DUF692 family protein, partial [Myxococcales bacterium]|nr:DUF692 family protein [Myxococcales bacterium]